MLAAPLLGAPFTYAAVAPGKETASGQYDARRLAALLFDAVTVRPPGKPAGEPAAAAEATMRRLRYSNDDCRAVGETIEHVVASHQRRTGHYTSEELPRGMNQVPYDFPGDPELAVLDEPTAGLDAHIEEGFYRLLQELNKRLTIVLVSHDLGFVSGFVRSVDCVGQEVVVQQ